MRRTGGGYTLQGLIGQYSQYSVLIGQILEWEREFVIHLLTCSGIYSLDRATVKVEESSQTSLYFKLYFMTQMEKIVHNTTGRCTSMIGFA